MKYLKLFPGAIIAFIILFQLSCNKNTESGFASIIINHTVSGENLVFENIKYNAAAGHIYSVDRLKYYLSGIRLHQSNGRVVNIEKVHYVDAAIEGTKSVSLGQIPAGDYDERTPIF